MTPNPSPGWGRQEGHFIKSNKWLSDKIKAIVTMVTISRQKLKAKLVRSMQDTKTVQSQLQVKEDTFHGENSGRFSTALSEHAYWPDIVPLLGDDKE